MSPTAYILNQPLVTHSPTRWDIHARYAICLPGETLELPAGTWLLALPTDTGDVPHYRLADGRVVCLDVPLTPGQATPLTDPQAELFPDDLLLWPLDCGPQNKTAIHHIDIRLLYSVPKINISVRLRTLTILPRNS